VERLPPCQRWLLVDRSPDLLSLVHERTAAWATSRGYTTHATPCGFAIEGPRLHCTVTTRQMDLNLPLDAALFAGRHLVTGAALLDLVSEAWLRAVTGYCLSANAAALFALTYNGHSSFSPPEPEDEPVRDLLNAHQHSDKGLGGPALGPDAHPFADSCFREAGYVVQAAVTDWAIEPAQRELQHLLTDGLAGAALQFRPDLTAVIGSWRRRRRAHVDAHRSHAVVGHHDLAAWPPSR
jgi:hypothetical protein